MVSGDFNGDGSADLAVGVPGANHLNINDGAVRILYGHPSEGLQTSSPNDRWTATAPPI